MKKYLTFFIILIFAFTLLLTGCGPKNASDKTLTELEELKLAADESEMEANNCASKVEDLQTKMIELEQEIEDLKLEIEKYK
ncbi:hypothetical protein KAU15_07635 [candidate division WOR-3 bacterium]|nr:hypothetical protein [candidate division WOR-3 bacterium]